MIELRVLGDPQVTRDGASVVLQRKRLALLAYLALAGPGRFVQRDTLLGVFWPDLDQSGARATLRQALHALRLALGHEAILTEGDERVALNHDLVHCDAHAFELAIRDGQLRTAVELYHGPVLSGVNVKDCVEFEHWLDGKRAPLGRAFEEAVEQLAATARARRDYRRAADWLRRLLQVDPFHGRVVALLMTDLEAAGERESAIKAGDRYVAEVRRYWDAAPDPQVVDLVDRLRTAPAHLDAAPTPLPRRCEIEIVREALTSRYDVLEELGGDGIAKLFLSWDPKLRRHVVLKVLKPDVYGAVDVKRFLREIAIVGEFNHPNIVPLFEAEESAGFLYYAMRHIPGDSLTVRLQREVQLPIADAVRIAYDLARALAYAHQRQVIHRDVKPRNVLLHERTALLGDFGTALIIATGAERLTQTGVLVGTPEYMSPEQAIPNAVLDGRTDVYALGCVLFEMLAGEPVFSGVTPDVVICRHRSERVPAIRIVRPQVSAALEEIITTALAKAPADRFQSAADFADGLEEI